MGKQLTKVQINHFMSRAKAAANEARRAFLAVAGESLYSSDDIFQARVKAVVTGEVELDVDTALKRGEWAKFQECYPPGRAACIMQAHNEKVEEFMDSNNDYFDSAVEAMCDAFVLGDIHEGNVLEAIDGLRGTSPPGADVVFKRPKIS